MSRNLCTRECGICHGGSDDIIFEEVPRLITELEAGVYFPEYGGRLAVMNAHCQVCDAKYLAWGSLRGASGHLQRTPNDERHHVDLSFRSSFNDEPGAEDLPSPEFLRAHHRKQKLREAAQYRDQADGLLKEAAECEALAETGRSCWEAYRR